MGELMDDNIQRVGKVVKDFTITISKNHLLTIPHGIVIIYTVVNGAFQGQGIDQFLVEQRVKEIERNPESLIMSS
jgi:predicted GNAT family acetyltransferase